MIKRLTVDHLRYGSVSTLSKLLGIKPSQLSAWFNTDRQINSQNLERIARLIGITTSEVNGAATDRRQNLALIKRLNQDIDEYIKEAQA